MAYSKAVNYISELYINVFISKEFLEPLGPAQTVRRQFFIE